MARHRSPRGRRAHRSSPLVASGRPASGEIVCRSAPAHAPLRRGTAAAVVSCGALTLAGVAATIPASLDPGALVPAPAEPGLVTAAAILPVTTPGADGGGPAAPTRPTLVPVSAQDLADSAATERLDTAKLVKAVQLAEQRAGGRPGADARAEDDDRSDERESSDQTSDSADRAAADSAAAPAPTRTRKPTGGTNCGLDTSGLGAVKPHVRTAALFLGCRFGEPTMFGVAGRAGTSDHPGGKAVDFMVDRATGDALAGCVLRNQEALGVSYVIWRQRINFGSGWQAMEDRGGVTANHFDHVHVSFESSAGGPPRGC